MVRVSDLEGQFKEFGFRAYEASVFVHLARSGGATAREVARALNLNRVQTYRALDNLESRGLLEVTISRPKRYAPLGIEQAFDLLIAEKRTELEALEETAKAVQQVWKRMAAPEDASKSEVKLQVLKGRVQIYKALARFVGESEREVLAFTTGKGVSRSYRAGIFQAVQAAKARGVDVKLVMDVDEKSAALVARGVKHLPIRHVDWQRARFILKDGKEVFSFLVQDESSIRGENETAIWTNSPDFVRAQRAFWDRGWKEGMPAEARLKELRPAV